MKLSISIRCKKEVAKLLEIDTSNLEIEVKEENCITVDTKKIILLLQTFYVYTQILIFLPALSNKL